MRIDKNTPLYTFGYIAWIRDRIFTKLLSPFMSLEMSVIFTIFQRFETFNYFNTTSIILGIDEDTSINTFGDIAWTRGRVFIIFMNLKSL